MESTKDQNQQKTPLPKQQPSAPTPEKAHSTKYEAKETEFGISQYLLRHHRINQEKQPQTPISQQQGKLLLRNSMPSSNLHQHDSALTIVEEECRKGGMQHAQWSSNNHNNHKQQQNKEVVEKWILAPPLEESEGGLNFYYWQSYQWPWLHNDWKVTLVPKIYYQDFSVL